MFGTPLAAADVRFVAYLAIAVTCLFKWIQATAEGDSRPGIRPGGWLLIGAFWVALAIFQYRGGIHELTGFWRDEAYGEGWYSGRRSIQGIVITGVATAGTIAALAAFFFAPRKLRRYRVTVAFSVLVACFIVVRSVSLHSVDAALGEDVAPGLRVGDAFEISAALVVCAAILLAPR